MNATKKRLVDLANGWRNSDAEVTLSPDDAAALGVAPKEGEVHAVLTGRELYAKARAIPDGAYDSDDAASSQQRSVGPAKPSTPSAPQKK